MSTLNPGVDSEKKSSFERSILRSGYHTGRFIAFLSIAFLTEVSRSVVPQSESSDRKRSA
jgi:hypothetical protein